MSFGEYTSTQFYVVFVAVIFSGEAAAGFFTYTTSKYSFNAELLRD